MGKLDGSDYFQITKVPEKYKNIPAVNFVFLSKPSILTVTGPSVGINITSMPLLFPVGKIDLCGCSLDLKQDFLLKTQLTKFNDIESLT